MRRNCIITLATFRDRTDYGLFPKEMRKETNGDRRLEKEKENWFRFRLWGNMDGDNINLPRTVKSGSADGTACACDLLPVGQVRNGYKAEGRMDTNPT
jgi:hypothetical protein